MIKDKFTDNELIIISDRYCKSAQSFLQVKKGEVAELRDKVFKNTSFLPDDIKFKVRLWHIINDVDSLPVCNICEQEYDTLNHDLKISSGTNVFPYSGHCTTNKKVWNTNYFIKESKSKFGEDLDYSETEYTGMSDKVWFRCKEHDLWFEQQPNNHLECETPCPECDKEVKSEKYRRTSKEWLEYFSSKWGDKYDYSKIGHPKNSRERIIILCPEHGEWETDCFNHGRENLGCPKCKDRHRSKEEIEVADFIISVLPEDTEVSTSNLDALGGKEIDIFIPSMNIGIEYNGIYWHSTVKIRDNNYHLDKTKRAENKGIRLIHIFSDEWLFRKDVVKEKLKSILGMSVKNRIYARNTEVRLSNNKEVETFYEENHIQGHMFNSSLVYVLEHDGNIVASMSLKKVSNGEWDITRYASSCHVLGGFTKLLSAFKKDNPDWSKIITFADRRWSNGDLYIRTGFREVCRSRPDYQYVSNDKRRINKRMFRHDRMKNTLPNYDPKMSEFENTEMHGIHRIYDCGLIKFEMTK